MTKHAGKDAKGSRGLPGPRVTVCRGCCCGKATRHPDVDHELQVNLLRDALGKGSVRVVDCLDACDHSNVVVVSPSAGERREGARPVWLGWVLETEMVANVADWVRAGGPGAVAIPPLLDLQQFSPKRKAHKRL